MTRRSVTRKDAEAYVELVKKRFAAWIDAGCGDPTLVEDWDGDGHWGIAWEGGCYEWAYYASVGSLGYEEREPEFGIKLPIVKVPKTLSHIFSEPYNACVLMLYVA